MKSLFRNEEILSSIKWYFEAKNLSLRNAISIKTPLSVEAQRDIRLYYSQYFLYLLSATELLLDRAYPYQADFKKSLENGLVFDGFSNGGHNYNYLRELRNSIVHRGCDITSFAHTPNNHPLFIAPDQIRDRNSKSVYRAYEFYIIDVIKKVENVIGNIFWNHIKKVGLLSPSIHHEKVCEHAISFIQNLGSSVMPEWVRDMALKILPTINFEEIQKNQFKDLKSILLNNVLTEIKI